MKPDYVIAAALAVPTVILAVVLSATQGPRQPAPTFAYSLAGAIENGDIEAVIGFLRSGQEPDSLIHVRHATLTGGRPVAIPPLIWAVATGNRLAVTLLIGLGASLDGPSSERAACLADAIQQGEIAATLRRYGRGRAEACRALVFDDAPLLWWAGRSGTTSQRQPLKAAPDAPVLQQPPQPGA